jgi:hypothetical protein
VICPDLFQQFQAGEVIYEARVLGDILAAGANASSVIFLDAFRAHDEQRPEEIYVGLDGAEAVHGEVDEVLDSWMSGWEAWFGESFTVEQCGVPEAFRYLIDILEVLGGHLVCH